MSSRTKHNEEFVRRLRELWAEYWKTPAGKKRLQDARKAEEFLQRLRNTSS